MSGHYDERGWVTGPEQPLDRPCDTCRGRGGVHIGDCQKPANDNARRFAWFTTDELRAEIDRREPTARLLPGSEDRCDGCGRVLDCCGNCNHCDIDQPRRAE